MNMLWRLNYINIEMNDSRLSDCSNNSLIQPVRQKFYDFVPYSQRCQQADSNPTPQRNALSIRTRPALENKMWKPKLPTKKLFQEPKFLMSIERKKIKVISGLKTSAIQYNEAQKKSFKSQKVKMHQTATISSEKKIIPDPEEFFTLDGKGSSFQPSKKSPHLNFNLQYLIRKRKTFKEEEQHKKGSNAPYFSFFASDRFDMTTRHVSEDKTRQEKIIPQIRSKTRK